MSVDFQAPFSPTKPWIVFFLTEKVILSFATTFLKLLDMARIERAYILSP